MADKRRRDPLIIELDNQADLPEAMSPAEAPALPELGADPAAVRLIGAAEAQRPLSLIGRLTWMALAGVITLGVGLATESFVAGLFERAGWLGWVGLACVGLLALALLLGVLGEVAALGRLRRIEAMQADAQKASAGDDKAAERVLNAVGGLYRPRSDMQSALVRYDEAAAETPDPQSRLAVAERIIFEPLDEAAEAVVSRTARDVAAATALLPAAAIDVLAVLFLNARMMRRVAEVYGGRAGWLGSWRLLRAVAAHLAATGAVAAADDILGPMVGGGVLGKLSRRFGEAAVNAALTARVGVAAIEVCRALPFAERTPPRASGLVLGALKGWRS